MNQNVPIIGQKKPKAGVGTIGALIRDLDENGEYDPESLVLMPDGSGRMMAIAGRNNIVTAADLVDMIEEMVRKVVREEMRLASTIDKK
jgi:hypothetical protein